MELEGSDNLSLQYLAQFLAPPLRHSPSPAPSSSSAIHCKLRKGEITQSGLSLICWRKQAEKNLDSKASAYNAGDPGLIPGSGRSPGEGNGNPLQYSCLENPTDWGS